MTAWTNRTPSHAIAAQFYKRKIEIMTRKRKGKLRTRVRVAELKALIEEFREREFLFTQHVWE